MSQKLNLERFLGKRATDEQKLLFAELAIERINERTLDGETIHGTDFKRYSPEYAALKGVTRDSVDLFLNGSMLDNVAPEISGNTLDIRITDSLDTKKGYNHQVGDTLPKRPWFGITGEEARDIAAKVKTNFVDERPRDTFTLDQLLAFINSIGAE